MFNALRPTKVRHCLGSGIPRLPWSSNWSWEKTCRSLRREEGRQRDGGERVSPEDVAKDEEEGSWRIYFYQCLHLVHLKHRVVGQLKTKQIRKWNVDKTTTRKLINFKSKIVKANLNITQQYEFSMIDWSCSKAWGYLWSRWHWVFCIDLPFDHHHP